MNTYTLFLLAGTTRGVCLKQWRWWTRSGGCGLGATLRGFRAPAPCLLGPVVPAPPELATMALIMPALPWRTSLAPTMLRKKTTGVLELDFHYYTKWQIPHFILLSIFCFLKTTLKKLKRLSFNSARFCNMNCLNPLKEMIHRVKTVKILSCVLLVVLVGQSVWVSQAHQEARTLRLLCAAFQPANRTTPLSGLSLTWSVSGNSVPWQQTARKARAQVASWHQTTAWPPAPQHRRELTIPTAAHGTPVAPHQDPGPTCLTACRSSNLWKVKASAS